MDSAGEWPEIRFVRPIPGFGDLSRFVLVTADGQHPVRLGPASPPAPGIPHPAASPEDDGTPSAGPRRAAPPAPGGTTPDPEGASPVEPVGTSPVEPVGTSPVERDAAALFELRSLERPEVRFLVAVPGAFFSDYDIELDDTDCLDLHLEDAADALVLTVLTVGADLSQTTANLLAPVVVNCRTREAAQVILSGSDWPVRAPVA